MECHVVSRAGQFAIDARLQLSADTQWLGLYGPSGAGKSTILRAIAGLLPDANVTGQWGALTLPEAGKSVVVSAQTPLFPSLTVKQNIELVASANQQSAAQMEWAVSTCECEQLLAKRPAVLSGGELQRAKLARALLANASVLLLDESFSAMDKALRQRVLQRLSRSLPVNVKVILVSHDLQDITEHCQQMAILQNGGIVAQGNTAEVISGKGRVESGAELHAVLPLCSVLSGPLLCKGGGYSTLQVGQHVIKSAGESCLETGQLLHMLVPASQVVLVRCADAANIGLSYVNQLPGKITAILAVNQNQAAVYVACAGQELVALVESPAIKQMSLVLDEAVTVFFSAGV